MGSSSDKRCSSTLIVVCKCPVSCGCIRERRISISSFITDMCSKSLLLNDAGMVSSFGLGFLFPFLSEFLMNRVPFFEFFS